MTGDIKKVYHVCHFSSAPWNLLSRLDTSSTASFTAWTGSVTICWMSENRQTNSSSIYLQLRFIYLLFVTDQELPCTPQSRTSPLPQPPRRAEPPVQRAAPQTLWASSGVPDLWTSASSSVALLLHQTRRLQARRQIWLLDVKKHQPVSCF